MVKHIIICDRCKKQPLRKMDYIKILAMSIIAGWDNTKIADKMGMTPQQLSNAMDVAMKKLKDGTLKLEDGTFVLEDGTLVLVGGERY